MFLLGPAAMFIKLLLGDKRLDRSVCDLSGKTGHIIAVSTNSQITGRFNTGIYKENNHVEIANSTNVFFFPSDTKTRGSAPTKRHTW